jgi:hypothetical protein
MKSVWTICALPLVITVGIPGSAQAVPSAKPLTPLEQTIIAQEKSYIAAAKNGDAEYFKRTFTRDYSQVGIDGQLQDRQEVLGDLGGGGVQLTPYNFKVLPAGEATAIVTYDAVVQVPPEEDQGPPPRYQHRTSIWVKQGDAWKLRFQQFTPTHWGDW